MACLSGAVASTHPLSADPAIAAICHWTTRTLHSGWERSMLALQQCIFTSANARRSPVIAPPVAVQGSQVVEDCDSQPYGTPFPHAGIRFHDGMEWKWQAMKLPRFQPGVHYLERARRGTPSGDPDQRRQSSQLIPAVEGRLPPAYQWNWPSAPLKPPRNALPRPSWLRSLATDYNAPSDKALLKDSIDLDTPPQWDAASRHDRHGRRRWLLRPFREPSCMTTLSHQGEKSENTYRPCVRFAHCRSGHFSAGRRTGPEQAHHGSYRPAPDGRPEQRAGRHP